MGKAAGDAVISRTSLATGDGRNTDVGGKFLTFFLANEEYGVEILKVHEIIGLLPITGVPRTPHFIRGVINLRGKVIAVVDLRLKFGMTSSESTAETCIIVVHVHGLEMGIIVDKVSEVVNISGSDIDPAPSFGSDVTTDYILGIGKSQGKVKILLDIERVLSTNEIVNMSSSLEAVTEERLKSA